jgi:uncharacterized protein (UPF0212 family)
MRHRLWGAKHTPAYVSIRQHTSADECSTCGAQSICQRTSAYVSIRQRMSALPAERKAYVSVRQHMSADECSTCGAQSESHVVVSAALRGACVSYAYVSVPQHTYHTRIARIRQRSSAYRTHTSAYVSCTARCLRIVRIRQHTSAHVCIRQHTSAYVMPAYRSAMRSACSTL